MARGGGLARALSRRGSEPRGGGKPDHRPEGLLVWLVVPDPDRQPAAELLAELMIERIAGDGGEVSVLISLSGSPLPGPDDPNLQYAPIPAEENAEIDAFLSHWQPDLVVWFNGHLRHMLLSALRRMDLPVLLAGAEESAITEPRWSLRTGQARRALGGFTAIHAATAAAARRLQRLGASGESMRVSAPLQEGGIALPCDDADRDELSAHLAGRPLWLAAMVYPGELAHVLDAQRRASRMAHRLLLVVVPDNPEDSDAMARQLDREGWRYQRWSDGDYPREDCQVLLADTRGEMGLWYRLCPVTFMAGSLLRGMKGHDPFEPAAHGSAIIYGPYVARHLPAYTRLSQAGAARIVRDSEGLQTAVSLLLAPDQAAGMASAAWTVSTEGAEATDRVVDWVIGEFEERGMF
ncbi:3-deoxy-D-manno-octulosonic acid transferase [Pseudooceanicola sp. HF7]|uniref:3-deoxy-D-manno-octulosonic acid transferase n=1 Tax=Pseudooceanicola sp. HF7 TaxID=2721560 RepID=UPI00143206AB|nr:glycosyltransferase N-terminal domain-containing protein [Pseudooceanicola sp. HF7]NIZ10534.1 3-deoxy-D-manno-octulosonic acid transferase [Pseudooceanicola sp. HF7]